MKPPYSLTPKILELIVSVSELLGEVRSSFLDKPSPQLRKHNQIRTIHNSLKIEGNTLTEGQITALVSGKRVVGPKKDIDEVLNAISVYENLDAYVPDAQESFLLAHKELMTGLIERPGMYRNQGVGIVKGKEVRHVAPPYDRVPYLMQDLFEYLRSSDELPLIKSCVFHYEVEFIHPFLDGNGRMGRLWQTVILAREYPVFRFLPFESVISLRQEAYYQVLAACDAAGNSTEFIVFMLEVIRDSLQELIHSESGPKGQSERLAYFMECGFRKFTRADYLELFKNISSATASRDLAEGVRLGFFSKQGEKNQTVYRVKGRK